MMINNLYFKTLNQKISAIADDLDISSISKKSEELTRLSDAAHQSLLNLLAFTNKIGVSFENNHQLLIALDTLAKDINEERYVQTMNDGSMIGVNVNVIDAFLYSAVESRRLLAKHYGVNEQDVLRYEQCVEDGIDFVAMPCNHPGCLSTKRIGFSDPEKMMAAERLKSLEIWYCFHHRVEAFNQAGALSDEWNPVLKKIQQCPKLTLKETGVKREDIACLEEIGLVSVQKVCQGTRTVFYQISLTGLGEKTINQWNSFFH